MVTSISNSRISQIPVHVGYRPPSKQCIRPRNNDLFTIHSIEVRAVNRTADRTTNHNKNAVNYENLKYINANSINGNSKGCSKSVPDPNHSKFALLNVRSLKSKVDIVKDYIIEKHVDIFVLTETWMDDSCTYESEEVTPSGYTFLRVDRQNNRGGGVGFISKEEYKPRLLKSQQYASFEHCVVELKHTTVLKFVVIYRPPSSSFACFISELINFLRISSGLILIIEDQVMMECVLSKFSRDLDLKKELLDTRDDELVEGNWWGDKYWGMVLVNNKWEGKNMLGKILMQIREELNRA